MPARGAMDGLLRLLMAASTYHTTRRRATPPNSGRRLKKVQMRGGDCGGTPRRSSHSALASWLRPSARTATYVERVPPQSPHSRRWAFFSRLLGAGLADGQGGHELRAEDKDDAGVVGEHGNADEGTERSVDP